MATEGLVQQRFGKSGGSVLRMTVFRKFEVCASYEHLWLNRHLRQAAKRYVQPYERHCNQQTILLK